MNKLDELRSKLRHIAIAYMALRPTDIYEACNDAADILDILSTLKSSDDKCTYQDLEHLIK